MTPQKIDRFGSNAGSNTGITRYVSLTVWESNICFILRIETLKVAKILRTGMLLFSKVGPSFKFVHIHLKSLMYFDILGDISR